MADQPLQGTASPVWDPEPCYRGIGKLSMDHNCIRVRRWFRARWRCVECGRWFKEDTR